MDQLDEVRSKIDIVQLISEYLPLKKSGRNFKSLCPFHSEKTPSFMVSPERQIFKCFGCGEGGDIFGFLMKMEGMEFGEALRALAKRTGVKLAPYRPGPQEEEKEKLYQINHLTSEFYHYLLVSHPVGKPALNYILGRGIKKQSLQLFKLGYAPPLFWGLQKFLVSKKGYKPEDLIKAGLATKQNTRFVDFFRDRIIFPLRDHRGNFVGFSARVVGPWSEEVGKGPKYINTPETLVYQKGNLLYGLEVTKNMIKSKNQAIVVEGELDFISSFQIGLENIVAIKGSALTEAHAKLLKKFCENIVLALDMDIAGDQATRRGIEIADSLGLNIRVARIPQGKDPDELAQKDPSALKKAILKAIPVYDFFIESAFLRFDVKTPEGKRKVGLELLPSLSRISDEIIKDYYVRELAAKLGASQEAILAQMAKPSQEPEFVTKRKTKEEKPEVRLRQEVLEEYLFALAFQGEEQNILLKPQIKKLIKTSFFVRILEFLDKALKKKKVRFKSEEFAKKLPSELLEIFDGFYLKDLGEKITEEGWRKRELKKTVFELEKLEAKEKLQKLSQEMAVWEKKKDFKEPKKLKEEFKKISQRISELGEGE